MKRQRLSSGASSSDGGFSDLSGSGDLDAFIGDLDTAAALEVVLPAFS